MLDAKRTNWKKSLKSGSRLSWFEAMNIRWFVLMGIFWVYKAPAPAMIFTMIEVLYNNAKTQYPVGYHSSDPTYALDEDLPEFVKLCWEFED